MTGPEPRSLVRLHFVAMLVWAALGVPTVLVWRESILWVAFMSLYANFVGHFSGWDAARAEQAQSEAGMTADQDDWPWHDPDAGIPTKDVT